MGILSLYDVIDLKKEASDRFGYTIHMHDACGGQSFSTEEPMSGELKTYIEQFCTEKGLTVQFMEGGKFFGVR